MTLKTNSMAYADTKHFLIDAGAVYLNLELDPLDGSMVAGDMLGVTHGGNSFNVNLELRDIEADGKKGRTKGMTVLESVDPTLTVNLKSMTAERLAQAIAGSYIDDTSNSVYDIITSKHNLELTDYINNVALVGRLTENGKPAIFVIENVLSLEGLQVTTNDKGEVVIPITFGGHYDTGHYTGETVPYKIYFPKDTTTTPTT